MSTRAGYRNAVLHTVLDPLYSLIAVPSILERRVAVTVYVCRSGACSQMNPSNMSYQGFLCLSLFSGSRTSNSPWLPEQSSTKGDVVHARSDLFIPASDNDAGHKPVLVIVTDLLEYIRCSRHSWCARVLSVDGVQGGKQSESGGVVAQARQ